MAAQAASSAGPIITMISVNVAAAAVVANHMRNVQRFNQALLRRLAIYS